MFLLKDLPNDKVLTSLVKDFPNMEFTSVSSFLRIIRLGSIYLEKLDKMLGAYGITHGRWITLILLKRQTHKRALPSELAKQQGVTKATISGLIKLLNTEGYVERSSNKSDKRKNLVILTEKGENLLKKIMPAYYEFVSDLLESLCHDEQEVLIQLLDKLL